jgi:hypothetical protein
MKRTLAIIGAAFAVALAVVIGNRMSADAMAVVVGVVCGVLASIPTSLLLIWALGRRGYGANAEGQARNNTGTHYPPVIVVNPGSGYGTPGYGPSPVPPLDRSLPAPGSPRTFKVVGDEETMLDELRHTFPGLAEDWEDEH